jgi:hypothetical protein
MGVEPQVDNVADAESVDIGQLRFGRLAGCRYPIIETTPVILNPAVDSRRGGNLRLGLQP